jgi:hypothetical protein
MKLHDFGLHGIESHGIGFHADEMLNSGQAQAWKLKRELGNVRTFVVLIRNLRRIPLEDYLQVGTGI